jgi:hypothetical protein
MFTRPCVGSHNIISCKQQNPYTESALTAIEQLLKGDYRSEEPQGCPIEYLIPEHRKAYIVPHDCRALLALITVARQELNNYKRNTPYYRHSRKVEELSLALDEKVKALAGRSGIVEYHANWLYSILTHEDVVSEHAEFEESQKNKNK